MSLDHTPSNLPVNTGGVDELRPDVVPLKIAQVEEPVDESPSNTAMWEAVQVAAWEAYRAGLCVLPTARNGSKAPLVAWKQYQGERPTLQQMERWFGKLNSGRLGQHGFGVMTGKVSGNLEMIDFDDGEVWIAYQARAIELGHGKLLARVMGGYCDKTPRAGAGAHLLIRCLEVEDLGGSAVWAGMPFEGAFKIERKPLIETRSDPGFSVCAPSFGDTHPSGKPYRQVSGGFATIATVTAEERSTLRAIAETFDIPLPLVKPPKPVKGSIEKVGRPEGDEVLPGTDFDARVTWDTVLQSARWSYVSTGSDGTKYYKRPGKSDQGHSASLGFGGGNSLKVFTSASELEQGETYTKFGFYSAVFHHGDHKAAAKELAKLGYGTERKRSHVPSVRLAATPQIAGETEKDPLIRVREADDDPHRLAGILLQKHRQPDGPGVVYHKAETYRFLGTHFATYADVTTDTVATMKAEFNRLNLENIEWIVQTKRAADEKVDPGELPTAIQISTGKIGATTAALKSMAAIPDHLDSPCWTTTRPGDPDPVNVIAVRNGLLDLATRRLMPHSCRFFSTAESLVYDYDFKAPPPKRFLRFMNEVWPEDKEIHTEVQKWCGYMLGSETKYQKMLALIGESRSGKGTFGRLLRAIYGDHNVVWPSLSGLATDFGLANLLGKRVAIFGDAKSLGGRDGSRIVEVLVGIVGEDPQDIRRKYRDDVTVKLCVRMLLFANEMPDLRDASSALSNRIIPIPMKESFLGREDVNLDAELLAERSSILNWMIEGRDMLEQDGKFNVPKSSESLLNTIRSTTTPILDFIESYCNIVKAEEQVSRGVKDSDLLPCSDLYSVYAVWCREGGKKPLSDSAFGRGLHAASPKVTTTRPRTETGRVNRYVGIELNPEGKALLGKHQTAVLAKENRDRRDASRVEYQSSY